MSNEKILHTSRTFIYFVVALLATGCFWYLLGSYLQRPVWLFVIIPSACSGWLVCRNSTHWSWTEVGCFALLALANPFMGETFREAIRIEQSIQQSLNSTENLNDPGKLPFQFNLQDQISKKAIEKIVQEKSNDPKDMKNSAEDNNQNESKKSDDGMQVDRQQELKASFWFYWKMAVENYFGGFRSHWLATVAAFLISIVGVFQAASMKIRSNSKSSHLSKSVNNSKLS